MIVGYNVVRVGLIPLIAGEEQMSPYVCDGMQ